MSHPHVALFPTAGMGHLTPFLRLASILSSRGLHVTFITPQPSVSSAESNHISSFFALYPSIKRLDFHILPYNSPTPHDPFFIHFEAINRSLHLLPPLLSSLSPPLNAIFSDFIVATNITPIADRLAVPNFIVITTSARFFSLMAYYPYLVTTKKSKISTNDDHIHIPGLSPLSVASIPPPLLSPGNNLFTSMLVSNTPALSKAKGILLNTFEWFDSDTITAFNNGEVLADFPPILPIGPLEPIRLEQGHQLSWLNDQPSKSVVYISFGSRTAMSEDQIKELGNGLDRSGHRFLWVLKADKVDKEDNKDLEDLLSDSFLTRTNSKGIVVKGWVRQEEILQHPAVGGFVSHCGWNSVMEAARQGMPMLAWPLHGDQRINAELVEKSGLGLWERGWGWGGEKLVKEEEIGEKVKKLMEDKILRAKAMNVGEEARKAVGKDGGSEKALTETIESLEPKGRE